MGASGVDARLSSDSRLHSGAEVAAAAAEVGVGAGVGAEQVFYLTESDLDAVLRDYRGRPNPNGQLLFMVIPDEVADARQRHLAAELLASAVRRIKPSSP